LAVNDEIQQAGDRFYAALNQMVFGDASGMAGVWSHGPDVTTMHPLGGREAGWEQVRTTWERAASLFTAGRVTVSDQVIVPLTEDVAYTMANERSEGTIGGEAVSFEHRVTNIYRREDGSWKLVHHHTDLVPEMADAVGRVMAR
jgi:ketosteroid isomerase-like protein